jgi:hypothetical protein
MKRFAILRDIPPGLTWEEVDSAAIQNMLYMGIPEKDRAIAWEPRILGVSWVRSYWEPGSNWGTCLYTAPDEEAVRHWHDLCQVPYVDIRPIDVEEEIGEADEYPRGFHEPYDTAPLLAVETDEPAAVASEGEYLWIRTYRYRDSQRELRLYLPSERANLDAPPAAGQVRRVVEIRPEDYQ